MKTKQILTAILLIALLSFVKVSASENASSVIAKENLAQQIKQVLSNTPFESLVQEPSEQITVFFKINKNHEFELIRVEGQNEKLINYSTRVLSHRNILVSPNFEPNLYYVPVRFTIN